MSMSHRLSFDHAAQIREHAAKLADLALLFRLLRALPLVRGYGFDCGGEASVSFRVNGSMPDLGTCSVLTEEVVAFPVLRWSYWSRNKSTAAVGTYVL